MIKISYVMIQRKYFSLGQNKNSVANSQFIENWLTLCLLDFKYI